MHPIISIVGSKGIGKSQLFNLLVEKKVHGNKRLIPTRDRQYDTWKIGDLSCILVDTGGITKDKAELNTFIVKQATIAIKESSVVIFLVDAAVGVTYADIEIVKFLKKEKKHILLLVNNATKDNLSDLNEFRSLGISNICNIANISKAAVSEIGKYVLNVLKQTEQEYTTVTSEKNGIKVAILGRPNAGKSTLVNKIIGENRVIISDIPGTTLDSIAVPFTERNKNFIFIDTAGVRRKAKIKDDIEENIIYKSLRSIDIADIVIYMITADDQVVDQDLKMIRYIIKVGKPLVLVINKKDLITQNELKDFYHAIEHRLRHLKYMQTVYISAKKGINIKSLKNIIIQLYESAQKDISTSNLTNILHLALDQNPLPIVKGKRAKLRYAHLGGKSPHLIIIHGSHMNHVSAIYKRYLTNYFYEAIGLKSIQIKLIFKEKSDER